jgi:hypothetical protein
MSELKVPGCKMPISLLKKNERIEKGVVMFTSMQNKSPRTTETLLKAQRHGKYTKKWTSRAIRSASYRTRHPKERYGFR